LAELEGKRLTTFAVAADGKNFTLHFTDAEDQPSAITLPTECLSVLLMTLPRIASRALRSRYNDASLRLVFPADAWRIENADKSRVILTIGTGGGFEASFAFQRAELRGIADYVGDDEIAAAMNHRLN
jgi:hypothetical protein